jgi:hypothetical protein
MLITLFSLMVALPRTRPYDDSALRAFLMLPNCPLPCFMGIRPGVTTVDEAITILQNHDWVKNVLLEEGSFDPVYVTWEWSGVQPAFINDQSGTQGLLGRTGGLVFYFHITTTAAMAEIWWLFQHPPLVSIDDGMQGGGLNLLFAYPVAPP